MTTWLSALINLGALNVFVFFEIRLIRKISKIESNEQSITMNMIKHIIYSLFSLYLASLKLINLFKLALNEIFSAISTVILFNIFIALVISIHLVLLPESLIRMKKNTKIIFVSLFGAILILVVILSGLGII
jgi:hypothetical protein